MRRAAARLLDGAPAGVLGTLRREHGLCEYLLPDRLRLPEVDPELLAPGFADQPVVVSQLPRDGWESTINDAVAVTKFVAATRARRVLELGSYSGRTAALGAAALPADGTWVAADLLEDHGWAYRGDEIENRIDRRVGHIEPRMFDGDEPFDLVFIDADHRYDAVARDTAIARDVVADDGWVLWHDYANWGRFSRACGVPEFLHDLSAEIPLVRIAGTAIATHTPMWTRTPPDFASLRSEPISRPAGTGENGRPPQVRDSVGSFGTTSGVSTSTSVLGTA